MHTTALMELLLYMYVRTCAYACVRTCVYIYSTIECTYVLRICTYICTGVDMASILLLYFWMTIGELKKPVPFHITSGTVVRTYVPTYVLRIRTYVCTYVCCVLHSESHLPPLSGLLMQSE